MVDAQQPSNLAVLTSGGDSPGMNAAVRAVVRAALHRGVAVFAIWEGYRGMVTGGGFVRPMTSSAVGGILQQGGTVIGTARSDEFRTPEGRRRAVRNLVEHGIDSLVVIGGDGSLTGADLLRREWRGHLDQLVEGGDIDAEQAQQHPHLRLVGMAGSIDNDMFGTDMTIGADTALHRITEAIDAIHSTAASHQRAFVIEVMGRHCGYLALMSSLATGANWVLLPEDPPEVDDWEALMCRSLKAGRANGRRQNIVIVAEGAQDRHGKPITSAHVQEVLSSGLGEDTRVTILGHVQRGGSPSAFDRYLGTLLGHAAVEQVLAQPPDAEPQLLGIREHEVVSSSLMECVEQTSAVARRIDAQDYDAAMALRGGSFAESTRILRTLHQAHPRPPSAGSPAFRFAVLHAGGLAPGMNTAVRVAVRLGIDGGHTMLGITGGFEGLRDDDVSPLSWMSVSGWVSRGGAELGTSRYVPGAGALDAISDTIRRHDIDGILMVGGWAGHQAAYCLSAARADHPALNIPVVCLPASINNDLPGSDLSIGADTALNSIVSDVDKIKQSAVASRRCFVVEVMGHDCGYLALMSGLATGAERVYLPEEGITLDRLRADLYDLRAGFRGGKRLGLVIRSENAEPVYTTAFIRALFEKEGGDLFDAREAVLGHVQEGGDPSPFDRIQATRLAARCLERLVTEARSDDPRSAFIGLRAGRVSFTDLRHLPDLTQAGVQRPVDQPWLSLRPLAEVMAGTAGATEPTRG